MSDSTPHVLVLGAGVNGVAIARELLLNGVPVTLVDRADIASGASAYNSRLIHGGLRYLEHGEFRLVRESLAERGRWLKHAPHLVTPLQLFIPCENRWGGLARAAGRLLHWKANHMPARPRGWWLVRIGLWIYDCYSGKQSLPASKAFRVGQAGTPPVDPQRYRWFCSYYDAQVLFPERLVLAQLADARRLAAEQHIEFRLYTYCGVRRGGERFEIAPRRGDSFAMQPAAVINATGASVDDALEQIQVGSRRLVGGTKGSHAVTRHAELREVLGSHGIYAEASDGRPLFLLPFGDAVLIGTTDVPFEGDPAEAVASEREIEYLVESVRRIFPQVAFAEGDIEQHYCGVRPLPFVDASSSSAITRRHWLHRHSGEDPPLFSVVGGKLTTCRQLAEDVAAAVLPAIGREVVANSRERPLPGSESDSPSAGVADWARRRGIPLEQAERIGKLCGGMAERLTLEDPRNEASAAEHRFPAGFVRGVIRAEQPRHLTDLVERRLMIVYDPQVSISELRWLCDLMVEEGVVSPGEVEGEIAACATRLTARFGKTVIPEARQDIS